MGELKGARRQVYARSGGSTDMNGKPINQVIIGTTKEVTR